MKKTKTPKGLNGVEMDYKGKKWLFSIRLQNRMDKLGRSDKSIYTALNMDQRTFSTYKRGECFPPSDVIFKLARELNCTSDYLIGLEDATDHDGSKICEKTGLSGDTVEILHEAVENDTIAAYQLLIDLFEYILKENIVTKDDELLVNGEPRFISMYNASSNMMENVKLAIKSKTTLRTHLKRLNEGLDHPEVFEDLTEAVEKRREHQQTAAKEGEVILPARDAVDFYCKRSASLFENLLLEFSEHETEKDLNYLRRIQQDRWLRFPEE